MMSPTVVVKAHLVRAGGRRIEKELALLYVVRLVYDLVGRIVDLLIRSGNEPIQSQSPWSCPHSAWLDPPGCIFLLSGRALPCVL